MPIKDTQTPLQIIMFTTHAQHLAHVGRYRSITCDWESCELRVHDNVTPGGKLIAAVPMTAGSDLAADNLTLAGGALSITMTDGSVVGPVSLPDLDNTIASAAVNGADFVFSNEDGTVAATIPLATLDNDNTAINISINGSNLELLGEDGSVLGSLLLTDFDVDNTLVSAAIVGSNIEFTDEAGTVVNSVPLTTFDTDNTAVSAVVNGSNFELLAEDGSVLNTISLASLDADDSLDSVVLTGTTLTLFRESGAAAATLNLADFDTDNTIADASISGNNLIFNNEDGTVAKVISLASFDSDDTVITANVVGNNLNLITESGATAATIPLSNLDNDNAVDNVQLVGTNLVIYAEDGSVRNLIPTNSFDTDNTLMSAAVTGMNGSRALVFTLENGGTITAPIPANYLNSIANGANNDSFVFSMANGTSIPFNVDDNVIQSASWVVSSADIRLRLGDKDGSQITTDPLPISNLATMLPAGSITASQLAAGVLTDVSDVSLSIVNGNLRVTVTEDGTPYSDDIPLTTLANAFPSGSIPAAAVNSNLYSSPLGTINFAGSSVAPTGDIVASATANAIAQFINGNPTDPAAVALLGAVGENLDGEDLHDALLDHYAANPSDLAAMRALLDTDTDTRVVPSFVDSNGDGDNDTLRFEVFAVDPSSGNTTGAALSSADINLSSLVNNIDASNVSYDNTASGSSATNVQDALDQLYEADKTYFMRTQGFASVPTFANSAFTPVTGWNTPSIGASHFDGQSYTAPVDGLYQVSAGVIFDGNFFDYWTTIIAASVDDARVQRLDQQYNAQNPDNTAALSGAALLYLNAGQKISVDALQGNSAGQARTLFETSASSTTNFFSVARIGG